MVLMRDHKLSFNTENANGTIEDTKEGVAVFCGTEKHQARKGAHMRLQIEF